MYFDEAVNKLIYGKKVSRASWGKNCWLESNGDSVFQKIYDPIGKCELNVKHYTETDKVFSLEDTLASDWEIHR